MRIYLDSCCLQRPLDDQAQPRIRVETEVVFAILATVQAGEHALLSSEALDYELSRTPDEIRRIEVSAVLEIANEYLLITDEVETLALAFEQKGIRSVDAVHLALTSVAQADFFCTCDDKLFQRARTLSNVSCNVITLLELVREVTK